MPNADTPFLGLAPFLRMSLAGTDLKPVANAMLDSTQAHSHDAALWLNLATVMLCLGQRALGLDLQAQALALRRDYVLAAAHQPARLRLLLLMVPGDLSANMPLDCLLEGSDIDLVFYYLPPGQSLTLTLPLPEHDALMVAMSEGDDNLAILQNLAQTLAQWPCPVINAPQHIHSTGRAFASVLLQGIPGLAMPPTLRRLRSELTAISTGAAAPAAALDGCDWPIIVRPLGAHGGHGLAKISTPDELAQYLNASSDDAFYVSRFIDYRGADGYFRKIRIALIDGRPYACHMAVSSHWMIHYVNAGMYEDAWKRQEELEFLTDFDDFVQRHHVALTAIARQTQLDYVCMDCAQTQSGELLIFEIDHAMVVHAMDTEAQFPYKQMYMQKVRDAFRAFLLRVCKK